jgi:hypothetical protein
MNINDKVKHVKSATQTRQHACHWPGCTKQVPPALWGCPTHWYRLPRSLRDRIWHSYLPGQEATGRPSAAYLEAAREVKDWITANKDRFTEPQQELKL